VRVIEPTNFKFNDDILSVKYESFSCRFDVNEGLDVDICVKYESFSFVPIITDHLSESSKFGIVKSKTFVTNNFDLY